MTKIKVAMCDDLSYLCEYFKSIIEKEEKLEFVGMAHNSEDCVQMVKNLKPDVLLLDIQMETDDAGIKIIKEIKNVCPCCKIIMLTIHDEEENIYNALKYGADNFILKTLSKEKLIDTIYDVANDDVMLQSQISTKLIKKMEKNEMRNASMLYMITLIKNLSVSEIDVITELCTGKSYNKIAKERFVSPVTIRSQVSRALKKLGYKKFSDFLEDVNNWGINDFFKLWKS